MKVTFRRVREELKVVHWKFADTATPEDVRTGLDAAATALAEGRPNDAARVLDDIGGSRALLTYLMTYPAYPLVEE